MVWVSIPCPNVVVVWWLVGDGNIAYTVGWQRRRELAVAFGL